MTPDIKPVLVKFYHGHVKPSDIKNLQTGLFTDNQNRIVTAVENYDNLYTGTLDNDCYNTFILVRNKVTNKLRLLQQVHSATLKAQLKKQPNSALDVTMAAEDSTVAELNKTFGSKKTIRITEQRERLNKNIEGVRKQLEKTAADVSIDETDLNHIAPTEADSLYTPPINRDASTEEQVYDLDKLVPSEVLESLEEEAVYILNSSLDDSSYVLTEFVKTNISKIQTNSHSSESKVKSCTILLYVNYLIQFTVTPARSILKRFAICETSKLVNFHILDNFSHRSNTGRTRPLSMKDKALSYILVLSLIAMDFTIDILTLSKDIKTGLKKIQEICRVVALHTSGTKVVLKLPLPAPVVLNLKRKRR